jgi:hypothetical protein
MMWNMYDSGPYGAVCVRGYADGQPWIWVGTSSKNGFLGPSERPIGWVQTHENHDLVLLDIANKRVIGRYPAGLYCSPVGSADGRHVYWATKLETGGWAVRSVDCATGALVEHKIEGHQGWKRSWQKEPLHLALLNDGRLRMRVIELKDFEDDEEQRSPEALDRVLTVDPVTGAAVFSASISDPNKGPLSFSPSGKLVVTGINGKKISLCDFDTMKVLRKLPVKVDEHDLNNGKVGIVWQADDTAFWMLDGGCMDGFLLVCVGVDGTRSPPIRLARCDVDELCHLTPLGNRRARLTFEPHRSDDEEIPLFTAEIDGAPADDWKKTRTVSKKSDKYVGSDIRRFFYKEPLFTLVDRAIKERHTVAVPLLDAQPASRIAALDAMAAMVADHAMWNARAAEGISNWRFAFEVPGKKASKRIADVKFFQELVDKKDVATVPALRRVIKTYVAALPRLELKGEMHPHFDEQIAALAHPMRALLLLDPVGSRDVFLRYLDTLDDGHASATWKLIFGAFVKEHGIKTKDDIRLGLAVMLHELNSASDSDGRMWRAFSVAASARTLVTGDAFAEMVMAAIDAEHARRENTALYDTAAAFGTTPVKASIYRAQAKHSEEHHIDSVIVPLLEHIPVKTEFGKRLRVKLNERWNIADIEEGHGAFMDAMTAGFQAMADGDVENGMRDILAASYGDAAVQEPGSSKIIADAAALVKKWI